MTVNHPLLLQAACKACRSLGIKETPEPTAVGNHQANGGAVRAVELIRSHANILITHVEGCCGTGKQIFGCNHPVYSLALPHAAWLRNRFRVSCGQTAFERATGRCYSGRIAQFGEHVFGLFVRNERVVLSGFQLFGWVKRSAMMLTCLLMRV